MSENLLIGLLADLVLLSFRDEADETIGASRDNESK
jgi:hypothetical protein